MDVRQSGRSEARRLFCLQIVALLGLFSVYHGLGVFSPGFPFLDQVLVIIERFYQVRGCFYRCELLSLRLWRQHLLLIAFWFASAACHC